MSLSRIKLPPYAKALVERLGTGWRPANGTLFISVGSSAWDWARKWGASIETDRAFTCLPGGENPAAYQWDFAHGFDVAVYGAADLPEDILDRLAALLLVAGAGLVVTDTGLAYFPHREAA
jgi:hypothetical protein